MAWKLALTLTVLNLIFDLLETYANFGLARSIVFAPLQTLKGIGK